ncbi:MAG: thioredoxin domain-containing protein, partial [Gammaproteobacteria bacterium]
MNHLNGETSPYLLQHADNPVEWYPWGEVALTKAMKENKPILLSIGYSACHWCHVMAHESFENDETAALMNEFFINIKVDREERPDIDKIYQTAQYLLTQNQGGWPLTMFLTPNDQVPFLGGTYFPPQARHGRPAFSELLTSVSAAYREREQDIRAQNSQVIQALADIQSHDVTETESLTKAPIQLAREQMERAFDHRLGGFNRAPKFPH